MPSPADFKKRLRQRRIAPLRYREGDDASPFMHPKRPRLEKSPEPSVAPSSPSAIEPEPLADSDGEHAITIAPPTSNPPTVPDPPTTPNPAPSVRRSARLVLPVKKEDPPQAEKTPSKTSLQSPSKSQLKNSSKNASTSASKNGSKSGSKSSKKPKPKKKAKKDKKAQKEIVDNDFLQDDVVMILPEDQYDHIEDDDEEINQESEQNNNDHVIFVRPEDQEEVNSEDRNGTSHQRHGDIEPNSNSLIQEADDEEEVHQASDDDPSQQSNEPGKRDADEIQIEDGVRTRKHINKQSKTADRADNLSGAGIDENPTNPKDQHIQSAPEYLEKDSINQNGAATQKDLNSHISANKDIGTTSDNLKIVRVNLSDAQKQLTNIHHRLKENGKYLISLIRTTAQDGRFDVDLQMTKLANQLVEKEPIKLDNGIEVIDIPHNMLSEERHALKLITRKHMRAMCEDVIEWLDRSGEESRAIITGSPGIGKSWSLIYLVRLLLKRGQDVLFANRKSELYVLFEHSSSDSEKSYTAKSCKNHTTDPITKAGENVWILVDPRDSDNDVQSTGRRLILAASPNSKYFPGWEEGSVEKFFLPMCSEDECISWKTALGLTGISDDMVRERFPVVGGAPRYMFNSRKFFKRKQCMEMEYLGERDVDMLLSGRGPSSKASQGDQYLASLFLTYDLETPHDDKVDYKQECVRFISHYAMLRVVEFVMKSAFATIVDNGHHACLGARFEDLVCVHLLHGGTFNTKPLHTGPTTSSTHSRVMFLRKAVPRYVVNESAMLNEMWRSPDSTSGDISGADCENRVLFISPRTFPIINFVDSESFWFSATTDLKPTISESELAIISKNVEENGNNPDLFWCVPERVSYNGFCAPSLPEKLARHVRQHILSIPGELVVD